jgi:hypothetical protein
MTYTVKRYAGLDGREYVALDDYARLAQECRDAKGQTELFQRAAEALREERDASLKQVEGLRALLHRASKSESRAEFIQIIDAATRAKP